jgi:ribosomal protein S18 acetylase RimI-like enzyme
MEPRLRPARSEDLESIAPWTQDTFAWGDYIGERFQSWLATEGSVVLVAVDDNDLPLALVHVVMASPSEAWMEGARVHPEYKRAGLGTALNAAGVEWARRQGARVVRLAVETDNEAARQQVAKLGYRVGSTWVAGFAGAPGRHGMVGTALHPSLSQDLDAAWMSWATGELAAAGRELLCEGWLWRTARPDDLRAAASTSRMFQSAHGWVIFRDSDRLETMWLATTPEDMPALLEGILAMAGAVGEEDLVVKVPAVDWAVESMKRSGFEVSEIEVSYLAV